MGLKEELGKYTYWLEKGNSPGQILKEVRSVGGWTKVFPNDLPLWAHRVRNYFNLEPITLTRFTDGSGPLMADMANKLKRNANGVKEEVMKFFTLSGDVYRDNFGRIWYQMGSGAAIYHYGSDPKWEAGEAIFVQGKGQKFTPVFKLISPDNFTGGSSETIIQNRQVSKLGNLGPLTALPSGESNIGNEGVLEFVATAIIQDPWLQGSYNYSETAEVGNAAHNRHDVLPHKKYKFPGVYLNVIFGRHAKLESRRFPERDSQGNLLANQN